VIVQLAMLAVGLLALAIILYQMRRHLPEAGESEFDRALTSKPPAEQETDQLDPIRWALRGAQDSFATFQGRLVPMLVEIAEMREAARPTIAANADRRAALDSLRAQAAELVASARESRHDFRRRGVSLQVIERLVDLLEQT
jgi:hypothetical protein